MFKLADFAVYAAILAELGAGALPAVTTSMTINFLWRPEPADLLAHVRLIKVGRRLVVGEAEIYSEGKPTMVAQATSTYALPPGLR
jgi:acyl-coenzyme A thioesterase PaaI-like protein